MKLIISFLIISFVTLAQAPPPQASGYHLAFTDNFDTLKLSSTGSGSYTWYPGIWWDSNAPLPSLISADNSALNLVWSRNGGLTNTSISTLAHDGSQGHTFRYGYFEARLKWDVVNGAWPAFWMVPKQAAQGVQHTGEIDIFEGQGSDPRMYYGTLHEWDGRTDIWSNDPNWSILPSDNDFSQWHTYGVLWTPGRITWYYDNRKLYSSSVPAVFDQQDFFLVLSMMEGANWNEGSLDQVTADTISMNVDWVRVWQK